VQYLVHLGVWVKMNMQRIEKLHGIICRELRYLTTCCSWFTEIGALLHIWQLQIFQQADKAMYWQGQLQWLENSPSILRL
jgi:hypothetical protein